jgi:hypothetical protein
MGNRKDDIGKCLLLLEEEGWSELIDSRWTDKVIEIIKEKYPDMDDDTIQDVLKIVII